MLLLFLVQLTSSLLSSPLISCELSSVLNLTVVMFSNIIYKYIIKWTQQIPLLSQQ